MLRFAQIRPGPGRVLFTLLIFAISLGVLAAVQSTLLYATAPATNHSKPDASSPTPNVDSDEDGLTDFDEVHKYRTDPNNRDSDGDGTPDGDWNERREFQYTIRSVIQVAHPVTIDFLCDAYQDAKILDNTPEFVELEVFHYPFNTVSESIRGDKQWRRNSETMKHWTKPGPSADWTPQMRARLREQLKKDGIDVATLDDKQIVERVSKWLCERAKPVNSFTTFITGWDENGKPFVPKEFYANFLKEVRKSGLPAEEIFAKEVSARGMFEHRTRGSCTSSAIYLSGCLKALGIPTRTVYCVPVIDASDEREFDLLRNIGQTAVRNHLRSALDGLRNSWASHTFNEVYVGGTWHRLNYDDLGQDIYDEQLFGLMTHVATFNDWADAEIHKTIGKRQSAGRPKDVFGFSNPYSTISLRDEVGPHCQVEIPSVSDNPHVVQQIFWTDDPRLDRSIRENCAKKNRFGFIAKVTGVQNFDALQTFLGHADLRVFLKPNSDSLPTLKVGFDNGCYWIDGDTAMIYVPFGPADILDLRIGEVYSFEPRDQSVANGFQLERPLNAVRKKDLPDVGPDLRPLLLLK